MGNSNQTNFIDSPLLTASKHQSWLFSQQLPHCQVYHNHILDINSECYNISVYNLQKQIPKYEARRPGNPVFKDLVWVYFIQINHQFQYNKIIKVFTQRIPLRLNVLFNLSTKQVLSILKDTYLAYNAISSYYGPVIPTDKCIGFNENGKTKVWLNQNFGNNCPQIDIGLQNRQINNQQLIQKYVNIIFNMVQSKAAQPNYQLRTMFRMEKPNYLQAVHLIEKYALLHNITISSVIKNRIADPIPQIRQNIPSNNSLNYPVYSTTSFQRQSQPIKFKEEQFIQKSSLKKVISDQQIFKSGVNLHYPQKSFIQDHKKNNQNLFLTRVSFQQKHSKPIYFNQHMKTEFDYLQRQKKFQKDGLSGNISQINLKNVKNIKQNKRLDGTEIQNSWNRPIKSSSFQNHHMGSLPNSKTPTGQKKVNFQKRIERYKTQQQNIWHKNQEKQNSNERVQSNLLDKIQFNSKQQQKKQKTDKFKKISQKAETQDFERMIGQKFKKYLQKQQNKKKYYNTKLQEKQDYLLINQRQTQQSNKPKVYHQSQHKQNSNIMRHDFMTFMPKDKQNDLDVLELERTLDKKFNNNQKNNNHQIKEVKYQVEIKKDKEAKERKPSYKSTLSHEDQMQDFLSIAHLDKKLTKFQQSKVKSIVQESKQDDYDNQLSKASNSKEQKHKNLIFPVQKSKEGKNQTKVVQSKRYQERVKESYKSISTSIDQKYIKYIEKNENYRERYTQKPKYGRIKEQIIKPKGVSTTQDQKYHKQFFQKQSRFSHELNSKIISYDDLKSFLWK